MVRILDCINGVVWGIPALVLIIGTGLYLSIKTKFCQIYLFPKAMENFINQFRNRKQNAEGISPYRALCTALAATVGTGNIAGVAGAITIGGPGAIFWMWVCGILGMGTKFAEATLATRYRIKNKCGEYVGGPMVMIQKGMHRKWHWLAYIYAFMGILASFGVGNATQINAVMSGIEDTVKTLGGNLSINTKFLLICSIAMLIFILLKGGINRIGKSTEKLVPIASICYIILSVYVILSKWDMVPKAFSMILKGAFFPGAVSGGIVGSIFKALRVGAARGVFTNEAGMGTASIVHASANTEQPIQQGFMGIIEVFIDTIVICTMTALVILCSGIEIPYGEDFGASLTLYAFAEVCGNWVNVPIALSLGIFALATIIGWSLYGLRCAQFIFGDKAWDAFVILQSVVVILGGILKTGTVWILSEIVNGLMSIPNLIVLFVLSPELLKILNRYRYSGITQ